VVNLGRYSELAEFPIVTLLVELPVFMFVAKFELLFMLTVPPDIVAPAWPVSKPIEVIVPVPVV
jgi:hypothetical protein